MTLLDHDTVVIPVTPTLMPAAIAMHAVFRASAIPVMATALDHDGRSAGNGRGRKSDRTERRDDITKLLHAVLLTKVQIKLAVRRNVPMEPEENSEQVFSSRACTLAHRRQGGGHAVLKGYRDRRSLEGRLRPAPGPPA